MIAAGIYAITYKQTLQVQTDTVGAVLRIEMDPKGIGGKRHKEDLLLTECFQQEQNSNDHGDRKSQENSCFEVVSTQPITILL